MEGYTAMTTREQLDAFNRLLQDTTDRLRVLNAIRNLDTFTLDDVCEFARVTSDRMRDRIAIAVDKLHEDDILIDVSEDGDDIITYAVKS